MDFGNYVQNARVKGITESRGNAKFNQFTLFSSKKRGLNGNRDLIKSQHSEEQR